MKPLYHQRDFGGAYHSETSNQAERQHPRSANETQSHSLFTALHVGLLL
jgi:hypothetical protein